MTLEPISSEDLEHEGWYYALLCNCGQRLAVHKDVFGGNGCDLLHLADWVDVDCMCGTHLTTKQLTKFKHSRHRT